MKYLATILTVTAYGVIVFNRFFAAVFVKKTDVTNLTKLTNP